MKRLKRKTRPAKKSAHKGQQSGSCGLLKLPPELRNMIYEEVLVDSGVVCIINDKDEKQAMPPLVQTCAQIREEALKVYFGFNEFTCSLTPINDDDKVELWVNEVAREHLALVPKFTIHVDMLRRMDITGSLSTNLDSAHWMFLVEAIQNTGVAPEKVVAQLPDGYNQRVHDWIISRYFHWQVNFQEVARLLGIAESSHRGWVNEFNRYLRA